MTNTSSSIQHEFVNFAGNGTWRVAVWVQPGSKTDRPAGLYQGCAKIKLSAPAVDNKANKALVAFVAKRLGLKKRQIEIETGHTDRRKRLAVNAAVEPDWERLLPPVGTA